MKSFVYPLQVLIVMVLNFYAKAQSISIEPNGINPIPYANHLRLTYDQIMAINNPENGTLIYDMTFNTMRIASDNKWIAINQTPNNPRPLFQILLNIDGPDFEIANKIKLDNQGNIFIGGSFRDVLKLSNSVEIISNSGSFDFFVAKYSPNGTLLWVKNGGSNLTDGIEDMEIDHNGNLIFTVYFNANFTYEGIPLTKLPGLDSYLILKYNSGGVFQWNHTIYAKISRLDIDSIGHVVCIGDFIGTINLLGTNYTATGGRDIFILKIDTDGMALWSKTYGNSTNDFGTAIKVFDDYLYIYFKFINTINIGPNHSLNSLGLTAAGVAKLDENGNTQWVNYGTSTFLIEPSDITVDHDGNLYVIGNYVFDYTLGDFTISSPDYDVYLSKFSNSGEALWTVPINAQFYSGNKIWLNVDSQNHIYVAGQFDDEASVTNSTLKSKGENDILFAKFNSLGKKIYAHAIGSADSEKITAIDVYNDVAYVSVSTTNYLKIEDNDIYHINNGILILKVTE